MSPAIRQSVDVEVRYAETDQMGVAHHATYLVWFELARTRLCVRSGFPYPEIERRGYWLMVCAAHLSYRGGARYGDVVQVTARLERLASRKLTFGYEARRGDELLVSGTTEHIWVQAASRKPCRLPEFLAEPFRRLAGVD